MLESRVSSPEKAPRQQCSPGLARQGGTGERSTGRYPRAPVTGLLGLPCLLKERANGILMGLGLNALLCPLKVSRTNQENSFHYLPKINV